jgi:diaminopimelate epimerase
MGNFAYMSGTGNDFIVSTHTGPSSEIQIISLVADSDYEVDGVIFVEPIDNTTIKMHYFNSDGSSAELCINGVRCAAKYAFDNDLISSTEFSVLAPVGDLSVIIKENLVTVDSPIPTFTEKSLIINGYNCIKAEVGNPHLIVKIDNVDSFNLKQFSNEVKQSGLFPDGINIEIYELLNNSFIKSRVYERGVGETDACGSGALCLFNYLYTKNKTTNPSTVHFPGGDLDIEYKDSKLLLTGTVTYL